MTTTTSTTTWTTTTTELLNGRVFLGLGANLGDLEATLRRAVEQISTRLLETRLAPLYRTEPILDVADGGAQPDYLNTAICGILPRPTPARQLLTWLKELERQAGRSFKSSADGVPLPRPLDIDVLLCDDVMMDLPSRQQAENLWPGSLSIPHRQLRRRRFVLRPLCDLAPDLEVPPDGRPVRELLAELGDAQRLERVEWRKTSEPL